MEVEFLCGNWGTAVKMMDAGNRCLKTCKKGKVTDKENSTILGEGTWQ